MVDDVPNSTYQPAFITKGKKNRSTRRKNRNPHDWKIMDYNALLGDNALGDNALQCMKTRVSVKSTFRYNITLRTRK